MEVYPAAFMTSPAWVREHTLLLYADREKLNSRASMLLLSGINDRLGPEFLQHSCHPWELGCRYREGQFIASPFGLDAEVSRGPLSVIKHDVPHDARSEVRQGRGPYASVL